MRPFLPLRVRAMSAVLHKRGRLAEFSIAQDREGRDTAAGVVRHQYIFSGLVDSHVAGVRSASGYFVQERELAGGRIDRKRAQASAVRTLVVGQFVDRV